jgi:ATP-binding cassette, subfamily C, bacterial
VTGGAMVVSSMIAARGLQPIEGSIEGWRATAHVREAYARIRKLLTDRDFAVERLWLAPPQGRLSVENVTYIPRGAKKAILQNVSFSLAASEVLAVIGPSGAGKSTLMRVLVGTLRPNSGNVRLDGTDIWNWDRRQLGAYIGYLPQSIELFPGTIASNIARMQPDPEPNAVLAAAKLANMLDTINRFSDGFNMKIGVDGAPLSGGQKQRVALARAFFGRPSFVVLDEPNSNLDGPGEQALVNAIENAKQAGMTVIAVTQRPSLLRVADKLLMLKDGRVERFGPAKDVLAALRSPKPGKVG